MEYNELMKELGAKIGLDGFEPDEDGCYRLSIDGFAVEFLEVPQSGLMDTVAKVCDLPGEDNNEQLCKVLLTAMAPGGTAEAYTFFIVPEEKCVYMRRTDVLASLDVDSYFQTLENFANALEDWRGTISDYRQVLPAINEALEKQTDEARQFGLNADGFLKV